MGGVSRQFCTLQEVSSASEACYNEHMVMEIEVCGTSCLWRKPRQAEALTPANFTSFKSVYKKYKDRKQILRI